MGRPPVIPVEKKVLSPRIHPPRTHPTPPHRQHPTQLHLPHPRHHHRIHTRTRTPVGIEVGIRVGIGRGNGRVGVEVGVGVGVRGSGGVLRPRSGAPRQVHHHRPRRRPRRRPRIHAVHPPGAESNLRSKDTSDLRHSHHDFTTASRQEPPSPEVHGTAPTHLRAAARHPRRPACGPAAREAPNPDRYVCIWREAPRYAGATDRRRHRNVRRTGRKALGAVGAPAARRTGRKALGAAGAPGRKAHRPQGAGCAARQQSPGLQRRATRRPREAPRRRWGARSSRSGSSQVDAVELDAASPGATRIFAQVGQYLAKPDKSHGGSVRIPPDRPQAASYSAHSPWCRHKLT